jgi:hypothetical protein
LLAAERRPEVVKEMERRIQLYQAGVPYRPAALEDEPISLEKSLDGFHN